MREHVNGIMAIIICVITVFLLIFYKNKIRKTIEKQSFWIIFNTIWLVYFIGARYIPYLVQSSRGFDGGIAHNMLYQNIFMTNVCPMVTTTIVIGSYFRRFREKFGPSIAMVALFGGSLNMVAIIMNSNTENLLSFLFYKTTVKYTNPNETINNYLWFMTHMILIVQGILLLMLCRKMTFKNVALLYVWSISFMIYVAIIMLSTGVRNDVGGLWINDWIKNGNYKGVFYQIGSVMWPSETQGWTSVAKAISGIALLYTVGTIIIMLSWYFVNYENKHYRWQKLMEKFKKEEKKMKVTEEKNIKDKDNKI